MKKRIFSVLIALVLVCSFSLVTAVPVAADYATFDNPNYYYAVVKEAPEDTKYSSAGLSPDGTQIVAQMRWEDPTYHSEIVLMNADGSNEIMISPGNSGEGDIPSYGPPFWSDDGTTIGFVERHTANPNKVISYDVASETRTYIYEPTSGLPEYGVCNPDFLGDSTTSIVFWDWIGADSAADLFIWDGTTRTNITNSPLYSEYEPVSNADGTVIVYWSGETDTESINTTHTLTESGGTWTKDVDFTPIPDTYWASWSGRADNYIGLTIFSTKDVAVYDSTGAFVMDLTGPSYSGGGGQWNFFGSGFEGPNGEFVMTSNARLSITDRDIVFANPRTALFVDDDGSDSNPGTEAAPFATVQKAIDEAAPDGTVNVAAGIYTEPQLIINKSLTIQGAGQDAVTITRSSGSSYFLSVSGAIDFTMRNLTIDASGSETTNFVAHISGLTSATFENVTVIGQGKDYTTDGDGGYDPVTMNVVGGLDLINVTSASLTNVTVRDVSRNGFSFTNVDSISLNGFTASNCGHSDSIGWAGLALYRTDNGENTLTLSGTNSISNAPIGVNVDIFSGTVALPGTGSIGISEADIPVGAPNTPNSDTFALNVIGARYKVYASPISPLAGYFFTTDDAIAAALLAKTKFTVEHVVYDLADPKFIVGAGMSIQSAIDSAIADDTITVAAGTYNERITIDKSLTLEGANAGTGVLGTEERGPESIINAQVDDEVAVLINGAETVATFDGFTVQNYDTVGILGGAFSEKLGTKDGEVEVTLGEDPLEVHILNNIVMPPTVAPPHNNNIQVGDGTTGTIIGNEVSGALLESPDWSGTGILIASSSNVLVSYNYVHNSEGGIAITGYLGYQDRDAPAVDNVIEYNLVEDNESGIIPQTYSIGTIIRYNDVLNNDEGIAVMGIDYNSWTEHIAPSGTEIHYNNIVGNIDGVVSGVWGSDTGVLAEEVDATKNWWGKIGGPSGEGLGNGDNVTANVVYDPWLTENQAKTVSEGIAYFGSTVPLEAGWNTLSVPLKLKDSANTIAEIMNLGDFLTAENLEIAYQYKSGSSWQNIGELNIDLVPLRGYYIKILGTDTVDFPVLYSGQLGLPTLELSKGWNLIGSGFGIDKTGYGIAATTDSDGQKDVATALYSIKDNCSVVVSPSTQGQVAAWGTTVIDVTENMIVGEAYWVFMTIPNSTLAGFEVTPIYYLP